MWQNAILWQEQRKGGGPSERPRAMTLDQLRDLKRDQADLYERADSIIRGDSVFPK